MFKLYHKNGYESRLKIELYNFRSNPGLLGITVQYRSGLNETDETI